MNLKKIKLFVMDMDGTIHLGGEPFEWTLPFLNYLKEKRIKYVFLTNNSSKSAKDYQKMLENMGIENPVVFTSGEATARYVKRKYPGKSVYILGTENLVNVFKEFDIRIDEENPDVLILGYDTTATYEKIRRFALHLRKGLPYIATHPDVNCPSKEGFIPDAGSFIALFRESTDREPDFIVGKPNPQMLYEIADAYSVDISEVAMIGDRLYTDIKMAIDAGAIPILVLSGETKEADIPDNIRNKIIVVENIG
ncbi:MAG: HAD-IIA family hydrolase, partial [Thermotogaceae bacterium]|nr:HAD-IIA family hydrolase [Thermotogaceae bacterium]